MLEKQRPSYFVLIPRYVAALQGLLKVSDAGVTVLASEFAGSKIRY